MGFVTDSKAFLDAEIADEKRAPLADITNGGTNGSTNGNTAH